jgi:hypothetical protein
MRALHGQLAFVADRSVGVEALMRCRRIENLRLSGRAPDAKHLVGMSRVFWSRLDGRPDCRVGSLLVTDALSVPSPSPGLAIPDGRVYLPRKPRNGGKESRDVEFTAPASQAVLVTNMLHGSETYKVGRVSAEGRELAPVASNDLSALYAVAARDPSAPIRWVVSIETSNPDAIDIATFDKSGGTRRGCP